MDGENNLFAIVVENSSWPPGMSLGVRGYSWENREWRSAIFREGRHKNINERQEIAAGRQKKSLKR